MEMKANQTVTVLKQRNKRILKYFHFLAYKHLILLYKRFIYFFICIYPSPNTCGSESCSVMSDSLQLHGLYSPWNSPRQNTGVGSLTHYRWKNSMQQIPKMKILGGKGLSQLRYVTRKFQNQLLAPFCNLRTHFIKSRDAFASPCFSIFTIESCFWLLPPVSFLMACTTPWVRKGDRHWHCSCSGSRNCCPAIYLVLAIIVLTAQSSSQTNETDMNPSVILFAVSPSALLQPEVLTMFVVFFELHESVMKDLIAGL